MTRTILLLLLTAAVCASLPCAAARGDGQESIDSAREALSDSSFPWYDAQRDELQRIELRVEEEEEPGLRASEWEATPARSNPSNRTLNRPNVSGLGNVMMVLFWCFVAVVLIGIIAVIVWAFLRREVRQTGEEIKSETSREVDRLEELPFTVKRPQSDLLEEARRLYEAGKFAEAIIYLFSYELVELDKHQIIRLTKGKTNRQYLGEARGKPAVLPLLEDTMVAFEDVFFGKHGLDRERFESCWRRVDEFRRGLQGGIA
jgi:hypothetical protein